jgi:hypothetical protein
MEVLDSVSKALIDLVKSMLNGVEFHVKGSDVDLKLRIYKKTIIKKFMIWINT